jgi:hypothetical protein
MKDVVVSDAVAAGRRVDLHAAILYYEILGLDRRLWSPLASVHASAARTARRSGTPMDGDRGRREFVLASVAVGVPGYS